MSLLVLKNANKINTISARITPKSKITALKNPFVALVSNNTKKTGPMVNAKSTPKGIAAKISSNIKVLRFVAKLTKAGSYSTRFTRPPKTRFSSTSLGFP